MTRETTNNSNVHVERVPRVWVVHDRGNMNFKAAEQFGEVVTMFRSDDKFNSFDFRGIFSDCCERFTARGAKPGDRLLLVGSISLNVVAVLAFIAVTGGPLSCLVFHANHEHYVECHLNLNDFLKNTIINSKG